VTGNRRLYVGCDPHYDPDLGMLKELLPLTDTNLADNSIS